jgi:competence protein ComEC
MAKKVRKSDVKRAVKAAKKMSPTAIILVIVLVFVAIGGYFLYKHFFNKPIEAKGEISFHFMVLGNGKSGDCTYIKAGENDILIDAGSNYDSKQEIMDYINPYMNDNKLEYVIATHAHLDHIACFAGSSGGTSLFDEYEVGTIIDFPKTNATTEVYKRYVQERDAEVQLGAKHYTALECYRNQNGAQRVYELTADGNVKMEILYNPYYEEQTTNENNYSVCVQFSHGSERLFLFTGDLEEEGEQLLVDNNNLQQVELFKAGHHGSSTASNDCLLEVIKPKFYVVSGSADDEYGFPHQEAINRIAKYTSKVYITTRTLKTGYEAYHGNVVVVSDEKEGVSVSCSNLKQKLKDTPWFKSNRTWPSYGVA